MADKPSREIVEKTIERTVTEIHRVTRRITVQAGSRVEAERILAEYRRRTAPSGKKK